VIVMPNMADEVLLGMNVLKHMSMQQSDGRLRLTAR
jgi:predicted aspartyl protease